MTYWFRLSSCVGLSSLGRSGGMAFGQCPVCVPSLCHTGHSRAQGEVAKGVGTSQTGVQHSHSCVTLASPPPPLSLGAAPAWLSRQPGGRRAEGSKGEITRLTGTAHGAWASSLHSLRSCLQIRGLRLPRVSFLFLGSPFSSLSPSPLLETPPLLTGQATPYES